MMLSSLTDEELKQIARDNPVNAKLARELFHKDIVQIKEQRELINQALDGFTQRLGVQMTVAGLMSFLLPLIDFDVRHFLIWIFPFLILALISFYFSSPRANALATQIPIAIEGSIEELLILKATHSAQETIWKMNKALYDEVLEWYRLTSACTYMYMVSFVVNFYLLVFFGKYGLQQAFPIFVASVSIGVFIFFRHKIKSQKNLNFGPIDLKFK
jgi:hypothetical protein